MMFSIAFCRQALEITTTLQLNFLNCENENSLFHNPTFSFPCLLTQYLVFSLVCEFKNLRKTKPHSSA